MEAMAVLALVTYASLHESTQGMAARVAIRMRITAGVLYVRSGCRRSVLGAGLTDG